MLILELCYFFYWCYCATDSAIGASGDATAASGASTGAVTTASGAASDAIPNATPISSHLRRLLLLVVFLLLLPLYCYSTDTKTA